MPPVAAHAKELPHKSFLPPNEKSVPGPEPERLSLPHDDWEDAVSDALKKSAPDKSESDEPITNPKSNED